MSNPKVKITRRLPATPAEVFAEWLDPDALVEWMCPRPAYLREVDLEAVEGGTYRFVIEDVERSMTVTGRYLAIDPPRRLQFTWSCDTWADPTVESVVTVTLQEHGSECDMTLVHERLPSDQVSNHSEGWHLIVAQLDSHLRSH